MSNLLWKPLTAFWMYWKKNYRMLKLYTSGLTLILLMGGK